MFCSVEKSRKSATESTGDQVAEKVEKQIPRRLKSARDDKYKWLGGHPSVVLKAGFEVMP